MKSVSFGSHAPTAVQCPQKYRLKSDLDAVLATISSLEDGLKQPKTVRDLVHPESVHFALRVWADRKNALQAEYEKHLRAHGC